MDNYGYRLLGVAILIILVGAYFNLGPSFQQILQSFALIFERLAEIPSFEPSGRNSDLLALAVRLAFLVAIVSVIKMLIQGRRGD